MSLHKNIAASILLVAFVGGGIIAPVFHQLDEGAAYEAHRQVEQLAHEGHEHDGTPAAEEPHDPADAHATCLLCLVRVNYTAADPGYSPSAAPLLTSIRAAHHVPVGTSSRQNYVRGPPVVAA